jgi:hypothetical protein
MEVELKRMAQWALSYPIPTPHCDLRFEAVFQRRPLSCPPEPEGQDAVVVCTTDARID